MFLAKLDFLEDTIDFSNLTSTPMTECPRLARHAAETLPT
jgi:hypothetical protein